MDGDDGLTSIENKRLQDHVGGAEVWYENGTRIWATEDLTSHFFKQYGVFRKARLLMRLLVD